MNITIHDCYVSVKGAVPSEEMISDIQAKLPKHILHLAEEWGWDDTEVRDGVYVWIEERADSLIDEFMDPRFCYQILAEAGMAENASGENVGCYTQANFEGNSKLSRGDYDKLHRSLIKGLSRQLQIPEEYFTCISQEEYDENE